MNNSLQGVMASATTIPVAAHVVGDAFVKQYYTVLHHSPQVVHRFYTDLSKLTRAESGPDGIIHTAVAQKEINSKVMSLDHGDLLAEIKTIDSQESLSGGVLVMVTGSLASKSSGKRDFVQTFFLAPQEKGYFVLNDMLRYLGEGSHSLQSTQLANGSVDVLAPPVSTDSPQPASANPYSASQEVVEATSPESFVDDVAQDEEVYDSVEPNDAIDPEVSNPVEKESPSEISPLLEEPTVPTAETGVSSHDEVQGQTPKKSYASILRVMKEAPGLQATNSQNGVLKAVPVNVDRAIAPPPPALPASNSTISENGGDEVLDVDHEGDGKSIYVKNLALNVTVPQVQEHFAKFGAIKTNGVNVRSQKQQGFSYAFVEFEDSASAQNAIDASPIEIDGRPAYVQEKRPAGTRGRGRGFPGRGDRFYRNDGMRGRGYFAGRGQGRAPGQEQYFRGRNFPGIRGGNGNQNPAANHNFSIPSTENQPRYGPQGSGGSRPPRRGAGNQGTRSVPAPRASSTLPASQ